MTKVKHYFSPPIEYKQTDIGFIVSVHGKTIGTLYRCITPGDSLGEWVFSPLCPAEAYYGLSKDMAVLNYFAQQYGGGLDDNS